MDEITFNGLDNFQWTCINRDLKGEIVGLFQCLPEKSEKAKTNDNGMTAACTLHLGIVTVASEKGTSAAPLFAMVALPALCTTTKVLNGEEAGR